MGTNNTFMNAVVFEIELMDGKKSSVTTIYNSDEVDFEEIVRCMKVAIMASETVRAFTPTSGTIREGKYFPLFQYERTVLSLNNILNSI